MRQVLHVGCGKSEMPEFLDGFEEVRLDIDPTVKPDIVASLTDMGDIGPYDAVFGSHVLEHLAPHEVKKAMQEFHRVLKPGGMTIMIVPDLTNVPPDDTVMYDSPAGPITGRDMYYGKASMVEENPWMGHKTGFVKKTLEEALGIFDNIVVRSLTAYNLLGVGVKK